MILVYDKPPASNMSHGASKFLSFNLTVPEKLLYDHTHQHRREKNSKMTRSSFVIEKNFRFIMVKEVKQKVERLFKVTVIFGEKDIYGQWVQLHGDVIDCHNAKKYINTVCNPENHRIFKMPEPIHNSCIEDIEKHTNAVIEQLNQRGRYRICGSAISISLAVSILSDIKESGIFWTPVTSALAYPGKVSTTGITSGLNICEETDIKRSLKSDLTTEVVKTAGDVSKSKRTEESNLKTMISVEINNNQPGEIEIPKSMSLSKNLFANKILEKHGAPADGKEKQRNNASDVNFSTDNSEKSDESFPNINIECVETEKTTDKKLQDSIDSQSNEITKDNGDISGEKASGTSVSKVEDTTNEVLLSDSDINVKRIYSGASVTEGLQYIPENVLNSSISLENTSFSSDLTQPKKQNRASRRLSMSLISVLNASNARMDNCMEASDTVKRAIISCLESEENNEIDDSVILVDNDEVEKNCIDITQIVISDDDDDDDDDENDVTVIDVDETMIEIRGSESEEAVSTNSDTGINTEQVIDIDVEMKRNSNLVITDNQKIMRNCEDESVIECINAEISATTSRGPSDTVNLNKKLKEAEISSRSYSVIDKTASPENVVAKGSLENKKSFEKEETESSLIGKGMDEKLVTRFTNLREKTRKVTKKISDSKQNMDPNSKDNTIMITVHFNDPIHEVTDSSNASSSNKEVDQKKKTGTNKTPEPDTINLEEGEIVESESGENETDCQKVDSVCERKKRKSGNEKDSKDETKKVKLSKRQPDELPLRYRTPYYNKSDLKAKEKKKRKKQTHKYKDFNDDKNIENKKKKKTHRKRKVEIIDENIENNKKHRNRKAEIIEMPRKSAEDSDKFSKKVKQADLTRTSEEVEVAHKSDKDFMRTPKNTSSCETEGWVVRRLVPRTPMTPYLIGQTNLATRELRYIVIDGSNVAMAHGHGKVFSSQGILLAVDYFLKRGHNLITVFLPQWRKCQPERERYILDKLEREGYLVFTPSRRVGNKLVASYDDRFVLELAEREDGVVVSNDKFRDLLKEKWSWRRIIEERLLMFSFARHHFMVPEDPLGRYGPNLDTFLRH